MNMKELLDKTDPYAMELLNLFLRREISFERYIKRCEKYIETLDKKAYDRAMGVLK